MKKGLIIFLLSFISLGLFACEKGDEATLETYSWVEESLTFGHPSPFHIKSMGENSLIVTESETAGPMPGEVMFELMITSSEASQEENIKIYETYMEHTVSTVQLGENETIKVEYIAEIVPDFTYTVFILETETGTLTFIPGLGHEDLAEAVIKSLAFL
jgi:hypothetical protein